MTDFDDGFDDMINHQSDALAFERKSDDNAKRQPLKKQSVKQDKKDGFYKGGGRHGDNSSAKGGGFKNDRPKTSKDFGKKDHDKKGFGKSGQADRTHRHHDGNAAYAPNAQTPAQKVRYEKIDGKLVAIPVENKTDDKPKKYSVKSKI